jgi:hypothetical protein
MPTSSSQSWSRGFSPLFRGPAPDQHLRVSDAERQAVADRLAEHYGDGRLDHAEFDDRVGRAMGAKTRADLTGLFDDLPEPMEAPGPGTAGLAPGPGVPGLPMQMRRRPRHPVLLVVLAVFVAIAAAHAAGPLLWTGLLVALVILATRGGRRARHLSQDQ